MAANPGYRCRWNIWTKPPDDVHDLTNGEARRLAFARLKRDREEKAKLGLWVGVVKNIVEDDEDNGGPEKKKRKARAVTSKWKPPAAPPGTLAECGYSLADEKALQVICNKLVC